MAESFALDGSGSQPIQATPQGGANAGQPIRLAAAGMDATSTGLSTVQQGVDPNAIALLNIASENLQPSIKAARQEQFMRGVQEAATGKALTEIINDRPWYTQLFGPGAAAEGARAYTVQAQLAGFAADMETQMPKLAEQGPDAMRAAVNDKLKTVLTGDVQADSLITGAAVEQFGPLFKRHAKEHYVYLQNKASDTQLSSWSKAATVLQQQLADPKTLPEDREAAKARFLGLVAPFGDQTEDSYNNNIATMIGAAATNGDFQVLRMFKETMLPGEDGKELSLWDRLPIQKQAQINAALPGLATKALQKYVPQYAVEMAMILKDTAQNPALLPERVAAFNKKVAEQTGIVEADMIPPQSLDNAVGSILTAQAHAASVKDPLLEQQQRETVAEGMLLQNGGVAQAISQKLTNDAAAEAVAARYWSGNVDPAKRAAMLNLRGGGTYDFAKADMFAMGIGSGQAENTKGVEQVAATFAQLSPSVQADYFTADEVAFYSRYASQVAARVPPDQAFRNAKLTQDYSRFSIPEKERNDVQKAIRVEAERRNESYGFYNNVTDAALRTIEVMIGSDYARNKGIDPVDVGVGRAYSRAVASGLEVIGKHAAIGAAGQKPLKEMLGLATVKGNIGPEEVARRFDYAVETKVKASGGNLNNYSIMRTADVNGDARYVITSTDDEFVDHYAVITGSELLGAVSPATKAKAAKPVYDPILNNLGAAP